MKKFAEGTSVPIEKSKAEIEKALTQHGASAFGSMWDGHHARITCRIHDRFLRFDLEVPTFVDTFAEMKKKRWNTTQVQAQLAVDAEQRRLWRAMLMVVKAKLEVVASGIESFEQAFLANIVLPNGETVAERAIPAVSEAYATGQMPMLIGDGLR